MANMPIYEFDQKEELYLHGQMLFDDRHFEDHMDHRIPIQVYSIGCHKDIGFIEQYCGDYVKVNHIFYDRTQFTFVSRPGF
ncbi:hypothetical protein [Paenibacillus pinihumi]|uniref:hypothetical protein n=1 Tax=Paenibacillus pinihumi TaxID=669462 RepID=UPI0003F7887D|nr:hypothetical protein [Paenibacillus pinihumi]